MTDLIALPKSVCRALGYELHRLQIGEEPRDWKPMVSVGFGVKEIRVRVEGQYRLVYVAKFYEGIYVLHVFHKKTQKTSNKDIDTVMRRYKYALKGRE